MFSLELYSLTAISPLVSQTITELDVHQLKLITESISVVYDTLASFLKGKGTRKK